jgi:hypothetical protein
LWRILWKAYKAGCLAKPPGKTPKASFDPDKRCDNRCKNARGMDCACICGGAFHSTNHLSLF